MSIEVTYSEMVQTNSFRILATHSYDKDETPLNIPACNTPPSNSLPGQFLNISDFREHDNFIQMVINAKTMAEISSSPVPITWRGYSTFINQEFRMTKENLKNELIMAVKNVNDISELERKVIPDVFFPH